MGELVLSLIPLALGIILSPLAIMALIAVLLSERARSNGLAFMLGWSGAVTILVAAFYALFTILEVHEPAAPPIWVPVVRLAAGLALIVAALLIYQRRKAAVRKMAAATSPADMVDAAPQLPGWLLRVQTFTPTRSFLLGFGIFALNPVDASCAILAALEIRLANLGVLNLTVVGVVFVLLGIAPIAVPVLFTVARGDQARPLLDATRTWIASNTSTLNGVLLLVIAVLQIQKAVSAFLSYD